MRFTNCFCTTSICCTSRASFLSGQYARRHHIWGFQTHFTAEAFAKTFPALVRRAGYRTGFIGKWGGSDPLPEGEYDYWAGFARQGSYFQNDDPSKDEHLTRRLTNKALEFLEQCSDDEPFCLQLSYKAPHCQDRHDPQFPYDTSLENLYSDVQIPPPSSASRADFERLPKFLQNSEARRRWTLRFDGDEMYQESVKAYYRLITGVDISVGKILDALRHHGFDRNTVVIFVSDNGYYLGEHGLAGKWFMHEPSIRLPLIIYDPRLPEERHGATQDEMVLNIDIAPTILSVARIAPPTSMQGRNLMPLVRGTPVARWRSEFLYEHLLKHSAIAQTEGVRTQRWKYVRYPSEKPVYEELFDLASDPGEENNLAKNEKWRDKLVELRTRCNRLIEENQ